MKCLSRLFISTFILCANLVWAQPICPISRLDQIRSPAPPGAKVARLYPRCDRRRWPLYFNATSAQVGEISLPEASRVIVLGPEVSTRVPVVTWLDGNLREGWIEAQAFHSNPDCPVKGPLLGIEAFLQEAQFVLTLSKLMGTSSSLEFNQLVVRTEMQVQTLRNLSQSHRRSEVEMALQNLNVELTTQFSTTQTTRVAHLNQLAIQLFRVHNPRVYKAAPGIRAADETLIVPLSMTWFKDHPELAQYFKDHFVTSDFDNRIVGGQTGEGIFNVALWNPIAPLQDTFSQYLGKFRALDRFIKSKGSNSTKNSPEAHWLHEQVDKNFEGVKRLIFIHAATWSGSSPKDLPWLDHVNVDQSIGGLPTSKLYSVLMHELSVNGITYLFFPSDSHQPAGYSFHLWNCAKEHGLVGVPRDPDSISQLMAIYPPMSLIYLAQEVQALEAALIRR